MGLRRYLRGGVFVSATVHAVALLCLLGSWHFGPKLAATRKPGTANGTLEMLVFNVGGSPAAAAVLHAKAAPERKAPVTQQGKMSAPVAAPVREATAGPGGSGQSALGDGNIQIALVRFHPRPAPDLSALPHGAAGDVILDATIDADGKITDLKVSKGFGGDIDKTVIATVQQWTFAPATKDGVPIASEQEILFHYEHA
ncbi:MAG TPA: TonB family protein [Acidobacteriaceae bacterium]|jgi:protein TonB